MGVNAITVPGYSPLTLFCGNGNELSKSIKREKYSPADHS
jgi:hypothetical protein